MSKEENDVHTPLLYSFKFVGEVHGEAVMKDRTRVLCDRTNRSAEKLGNTDTSLLRHFFWARQNNHTFPLI